jgi:hypothetical protein
MHTAHTVAGFSRGRCGIVGTAVLAALLPALVSAHAAAAEEQPASVLNLGAPSPAAGQEPWDAALGAVGLTRETFGFDYADMSNYGGDKYVVPLFYVLQGNPFKIEPYVRSFRADLLAGCGTLAGPVTFGERRVDEAVRRGLIADPIAPVIARVARPDPLFAAVRDFQAFYGSSLQPHQQARLRREAARVPLAVQQMAALVIYFGIDSTGYHRQAFREAAREFDLDAMFGKMQAVFATDQDIIDLELERFIDAVDFKYLYTQSQELAMAVDFAADSLAKLACAATFDFQWPTPVGKIVLRGASDDHYPAGEYFLIIDTGGNDSYVNAAANQSVDNWMSILVDLAGADTYAVGPEEGPAFGAGIFGYAYLVDASGDDTYKGRNLTQGAGLFGAGALLDKSGNDTYDAYMLNQGAGVFGVGTLSDLAGNDCYHTWQQAQGYGFTKGCGVLIDRSGDDRYVAEDSILAFPSSQTKDHNSSLAQGVGFGKRADYIDGHSWAGGLGFLIDGAGNDRYTAGLFAQGCAYWYAVGVLSDVSGNDLYDGVWYVQGSGAHFALGLLLDSDGDDRYRASMNMAQGAGHDFTLGYLIDEAGNDVYDAPYLSLGGGNANGIGIFWDKRGDDRYNSTAALTLGRSNTASRGSLRDHINTIGVFLDTGGKDIYPLAYPDSADLFLNNTLWTRPGIITDPQLRTEKGVGYDCPRQ